MLDKRVERKRKIFDKYFRAFGKVNGIKFQPVFKGCDNYVNKTSEKMFVQGLCLPSDTKMTNVQLDEIISIIAGLLKI
ncbi:MAG: hypothetical protein KKD38_08010 [Candidatus Delongbacteria bacterium]|nr:hypothetical protein [Candidatus Delongbacteria bacterium]MCG2760782.1 hypothetical protein [Candidatus Delongbacteria bacterium]